MNKSKRELIAKNTAKQILLELSNKGCFDGFITRFYTHIRCVNQLSKDIEKYFRTGEQKLVNWNKNNWFDIFDDKELTNALVWYMQDFNLNKEIEEKEN